MNKQLVVFSNGDAWDARTWSNVPYMFLNAFKRQFPDIPIVTFDMSSVDNRGLLWLVRGTWNVLATPMVGKLFTFDRTKFRHYLLNKKIRRFTKNVAGGEGVFLSFDFSNPAPKTPGYKVCLLCDWTIEYEISEHQHREPTDAERRLIERQREVISGADLVTALFPYSAKLISETCAGSKVTCYGLPSNALCDVRPVLLRSSNRLLFIGNSKYAESLAVVVEGLENFNLSNPGHEYVLDVIGMEHGPGEWGGYVVYHGYLRKDVEEEKALYYTLLTSCRALINVSDRWVGASSIVEALSLGTPVVVTPNAELEELLGEPEFGLWCGYTAEDVERCLAELSESTELQLESMSRNAVARVSRFTWDNLVFQWAKDVGFID